MENFVYSFRSFVTAIASSILSFFEIDWVTPMPKKIIPKRPLFIRSAVSRICSLGIPATVSGSHSFLNATRRALREFVIPSLFDLQVNVGKLRRIGDSWVDDNQLPAHLALSSEETSWKYRISRHMSRMGMCRIATPENDTVCPVFHFTKSAGG